MPLIDAAGTSLFYDLTGPDDAPVVAFSNSLGATAEMWDMQAAALASRMRVLRYDTRGHGRSPLRPGPVSVDDLADDWAALLDALGIASAHIVGLSLGGMTAQSLAVRHPAKVRSLTLMATGPYLPPPENWNARAATVRAEGLHAIVDAVLARWFTPAHLASASSRVDFYRRKFLDNSAEGYALCCEAIRDADLRPVLGRIAAPTLVVAGADDPVTPVAMAQDLRVAIPGADVAVVPRSSHLLAIEQHAAVTDLLVSFFERVEGRALRPADGRSFEAGLGNRKAVLGVDHVQNSLAKAGPFAMPWQDFITRAAWGEIWGDDRIPWKTRSMVTLAMMVALHREEEFKLHLRPALKNGVTLDELQALLLQTAIYAGVPAANAAFRWARDVLGPEADAIAPPTSSN